MTALKKHEPELETLPDAVLHEQQALQRIGPWLLWDLASALFATALQRQELVREVAPGEAPLERHDWERRDDRRAY